jgi:MFS family permease
MSTSTQPVRTKTPIARVVGASLIGTTVEWYDFFLYGVAASVVFGDLFFPKGEQLTGTLLSFATFAVGFFARPIGGVVFGHFGDRLGRKNLLVLSLLMMGLATFAIGLLPTYAQVGALAPVLLTVLRLIQGFALGGEWGGAVLIVSEHGDPERRGFWSSWPQAGAPAGQLIANGVLAGLAAFQSDADFNRWGWRIPFLLSAVLVLVGLWVRLRIEESPLFKQARAKQEPTDKLPFIEVITKYPREVLTAMGARMAENVSYYIFTIVIATYAKEHLGLGKSFALNAVLIGSGANPSICSARSASGSGPSSSSPWWTRRTSPWPPWRSPSAWSCTARCTGRRHPSSPSCSAPGSATPASRSATNSPRSSPAAWLRSSRSPC